VRPSVRALIPGGIAAFILLTGCGSQTATPTQAHPSQSVGPSDVPTTNVRLLAFRTHMVDAIARDGELIRNLAVAVATNPSRAKAVIKDLAAWTAAETSWIKKNPPLACYKEAHDSLRAGIADIAAANTQFSKLVASSSPPTSLGGTPAGARLAQGASEINRARALARDNGNCA
jgi:PBP1b-binding outer membrane lipoprotein LpoB